jgi:hypothetical protein
LDEHVAAGGGVDGDGESGLCCGRVDLGADAGDDGRDFTEVEGDAGAGDGGDAGEEVGDRSGGQVRRSVLLGERPGGIAGDTGSLEPRDLTPLCSGLPGLLPVLPPPPWEPLRVGLVRGPLQQLLPVHFDVGQITP